jgi:hypothetical protein
VVTDLRALSRTSAATFDSTSAITGRNRSTGRSLLGGSGGGKRCLDVACGATLCRAAVSLQGYNEGRGSSSSTPLLILTADNDNVAGPWWGKGFRV